MLEHPVYAPSQPPAAKKPPNCDNGHHFATFGLKADRANAARNSGGDFGPHCDTSGLKAQRAKAAPSAKSKGCSFCRKS